MNRTAAMPQARRNWFAGRRDRFVRQVVDDFFNFVASYQEIYATYLSCRPGGSSDCANLRNNKTEAARAEIWRRLTTMVGAESDKGPLWQLKDTCHLVWPEKDDTQDVKGQLLDWLIGSIFHEAMKLKENIYLLNAYGPAAMRISERPANRLPEVLHPPGIAPQLACMVDVQNLINRIAKDVMGQMEQISYLLGQANIMLRTMMPELASNLLVLRLLVEREAAVGQLWGESLEALFADMFFDDPAQGFCIAGRSYLDSQWYEAALALYERALRLDPASDTARVKAVQLRAVLRERPASTNRLPVMPPAERLPQDTEGATP